MKLRLEHQKLNEKKGLKSSAPSLSTLAKLHGLLNIQASVISSSKIVVFEAASAASTQ